GVSAVDLADGRVVAAVRARQLFIPASNEKLLTSAFALVRLGAGFRFATGAMLLDGNVVVSGEWDPTLGDPVMAARSGRDIYAELDRWAAAIRGRGVRGVNDILLCRPPAAGGRHPDWPRDQYARWYAAPVSTLNFHDNCIDVTFAAGANGRIVPVLRPASRFIAVEDRLRRGGRQLWSLQADQQLRRVVLRGSVARPTGEPISVAVDCPELLLGRTLAERLERAGVAVGGRIRLVGPREIRWADAEVVARTTTPLFVVMRRANKRSLNLAAEALFLRAGDGTWPGSARMMVRTLGRTFGLAAGSILPADGSGLSRRNRISPAAMTKILAGLLRRPDGRVLLASLPVGGVDGTLRKRFTRPPCRGRVLAKTGYIAGVSCLSGYVLDARRRPRAAFAVLVNDIRGTTAAAKRFQEAVCSLLLNGLAGTGGPAGTTPREQGRAP
ncbi:MAG: D-alanyl-D-alanine carboxypeptidase/D-alanyl-D-alanine-endopeptidase, partial [Planctomycetes bacterium]|nr:D-alanyl-D-alanine carboxypeptidase/D-alanyl-D-alanine-endopeptidase [Planctomycetota bacterium]